MKNNKCEICNKNLRNGLLSKRHLSCQKKIGKRMDNNICVYCDDKTVNPVELNIFCKKHFRDMDDLRSFLYRPKTKSLQDALDYFIPKGELKLNTSGFLMPNGVFYKIDDDPFDFVKDIHYSISSKSKLSMKWFLKKTGAVCIEQIPKSHTVNNNRIIAIEYYDIKPVQLNKLRNIWSKLTTKDEVDIASHNHQTTNYLKHVIDKKVGCSVVLSPL